MPSDQSRRRLLSQKCYPLNVEVILDSWTHSNRIADRIDYISESNIRYDVDAHQEVEMALLD